MRLAVTAISVKANVLRTDGSYHTYYVYYVIFLSCYACQTLAGTIKGAFLDNGWVCT